MANRVFLPEEDDSEDIVIRMTSDDARALYSLLSKLSTNEKIEKGLSEAQCEMISSILHSTY